MVQLDPTRKIGFLNQKNREFILGEWDSSGNSARQRRYRIRQQFVGGLRDLFYLSLLPEDDRDLIVSHAEEEWELVEEAAGGGMKEKRVSEIDTDDKRTGERLSDSGHNLLVTIFQELYISLNRSSFEMALEDGVEAAIVQSRVDKEGIYPDINPRLEIEEGDFGDFDVDEILRRIREGDGWLRVDREHANRLYEAGLISEAEYSELRESTHRVMSDEEQRLFELEREEEQLEAAKIWKNYEGSWSVNDVLFLRDQDYLTSEEATAILDGGADHYGFRYVAHCLRCAYESDDRERQLPGAALLPESAADVKITRDLDQKLLDELAEWHREEKVPQEQVEAVQRAEGEDNMALLSRCPDFEAPAKSPSVVGEDLSMPMLSPDFEPKHDPEESPSPDELTPTQIEALYQDGLLSEDRYHELLRDRLELAPNLLTDEQVRSLFAAGEIGINEVRSVLDPKDIDEEYIVDIYQKERIDQKQYLDMLEMKYRIYPGSISHDHLRELVDEGRIDPAEAPPAAHFHLLKAQVHTPEEFLDGLEAAYERSPEKFKQDDLLKLYDADRLSAEEVVNHPNVSYSDTEHLIDGEPVTENHPEGWGVEWR